MHRFDINSFAHHAFAVGDSDVIPNAGDTFDGIVFQDDAFQSFPYGTLQPTLIDQSEVYTPKNHYLNSVLIDQSEVYSPQSVINDIVLTSLSIAEDTYYDNVVLQLFMEGSNGASVFTDTSKYLKSASYATATTSTAQSFTGNTSALFTQVSSSLGKVVQFAGNSDWEFGSGDFHITLRVYPLSGSVTDAGSAGLIAWRNYNTDQAWSLRLTDSDRVLEFEWNNRSGWITSPSLAVNLNEWSQIEVCRIGNYVYMFVNGVLVVTSPNINPTTFSSMGSYPIQIGRLSLNPQLEGYFKGYIDEVQVTKGVGRFSASHTPYLLRERSTYIFSPNAFTSTAYVNGAVVIDQSFVQAPSAYLKTQIIIPSYINDSSIYVCNVINKNVKLDAAPAIDTSAVYAPTSYLAIQVLLGATSLDTSAVYAPTAYNYNQYLDATTSVDQSIVYNPNISLSRQFFDAAVAVDQSIVYVVESATTVDRTFTIATAIDQSTVYLPTVIFSKQIFNAVLIDQSVTYNPNALNSIIDIHPDYIDTSEVYPPTVFVADTTYFADTVINQSVVYPVLDVSFRVRYYDVLVIDQSEVYLPISVLNVNQTIIPESIDQSIVYGLESVSNTNRTFIAGTVIDQSEVYLPDVYNTDRFYSANTVIDQSVVYNPIADNKHRTIIPEGIDQSIVYAPTSTGPVIVLIDGLAYTGETIDSSIEAFSTHVLFAQSRSNGESVSAELALNEGALLEALAGASGERIESLSLQDDFPGISNAISNSNGEVLAVSGLEEDYLIHGYTGEQVYPVQFTTEYVLDIKFDSDVYVSASLDDHPSFYIPNLVSAVDDASFFCVLNALYEGAILHSYLINSQPIMSAYFDYPFELDLSQDCICSGPRPFVHTNLDIEFNNGEKIFDKFRGDGYYMYAELSCQKYLSAIAYAGESATLKSPESYAFELEPMQSGLGYSSAALNFDINRFRLCKGNYNLSGSNAPLEMFDALGDNCQENFAYTSEKMYLIDLNNNVRLYPEARFGTEMIASLTTDPPWGAIIPPPSEMFSKLSVNTTFGEALAMVDQYSYATLYEELIIAHAGEAMICPTITIEYAVEFLESGTILNEYQYLLPNGDVDREKTRIAPTEGYYYNHYLKARCF